MKIVLGGMRIPRLPPAATTPVARAGSYRYFFISGRATEAIVAAVALVEPQMAEKPAQAPIVAMARPPGQVTQKLVGRVEEPAADPRVMGDLSHENEQGDDRQVVGTEGGEEIPCEQVQGGVPGGQKGRSRESRRWP